MAKKKKKTSRKPHEYVLLSYQRVLEVLDGRSDGPLPEDFYGYPPRPDIICSALPGSEEKIVMLMERYEQRRQLFHPRDRKE